jgi:hypothetical protein
MNINDITPSRQYSWVYTPSAEQFAKNKLNKGGRSGVAPNPYYGKVTCRAVYTGQAASAAMYEKAALAANSAWQPSDRGPMFELTENPCVVRSLSTGELQARILKPRATKKEYFLDGRPMTQEELAILKPYFKVRPPSEKPSVKIMFPYIANLANVEGELEEVEGDDED